MIKTSIKKLNNKLKEKNKYLKVIFILILLVSFISSSFLKSDSWVEKKKTNYNKLITEYSDEISSNNYDLDIEKKQKDNLIKKIEKDLVLYLSKSRNYDDINVLKEYFKYTQASKLLEGIPSQVPLKRGNYSLTSMYGIRFHPINKKMKKHFGLDLAANKGTKVYSTASGKVEKIVKAKTGYGKYIIIRSRFGFKSLYGHLSKILVNKGDYVNQGELIGLVGSTGNSTGNHLHYEIIKNGKKIDPFASFNLRKDVISDSISNNRTINDKKIITNTADKKREKELIDSITRLYEEYKMK